MKKALGLKSPGPPPSPRVFGCVIGVQRGRTVEIFNSFELLYDPDTHSLERGFLEKKQELYKKVFPNFYILGWHSTGSDAQESDMTIHKADSHMLKPALKYLTAMMHGHFPPWSVGVSDTPRHGDTYRHGRTRCPTRHVACRKSLTFPTRLRHGDLVSDTPHQPSNSLKENRDWRPLQPSNSLKENRETETADLEDHFLKQRNRDWRPLQPSNSDLSSLPKTEKQRLAITSHLQTATSISSLPTSKRFGVPQRPRSPAFPPPNASEFRPATSPANLPTLRMTLSEFLAAEDNNGFVSSVLGIGC